MVTVKIDLVVIEYTKMTSTNTINDKFYLQNIDVAPAFGNKTILLYEQKHHIGRHLMATRENYIKIRLYTLAVNILRIFGNLHDSKKFTRIAYDLILFLREETKQNQHRFIYEVAYEDSILTYLWSEYGPVEHIRSLFIESPSLLFDSYDDAEKFLDDLDYKCNNVTVTGNVALSFYKDLLRDAFKDYKGQY